MNDGSKIECCDEAPNEGKSPIQGLCGQTDCQSEAPESASREVVALTRDFVYVVGELTKVWPTEDKKDLIENVRSIMRGAYAREDVRLDRMCKERMMDKMLVMQQQTMQMLDRIDAQFDKGEDDETKEASPAAAIEDKSGDAEPGAAPESECCQNGACSAAAGQ